MLFNSIPFVAFFLLVFLINLKLPHRGRNVFLLAMSYVFYATWNWKFLGLIWLSTGIDFVAGRLIGNSDDPRLRKVVLLFSVVTNLTILSFFKYYNFFIDSLDPLLAVVGSSTAALRLDLVLPIGISFYTFQTMSYTIDVYRGKMKPVTDLLDFSLFICFFPQLVSGPIERAPRLMPQIQNPRRITAEKVHSGFALTMWGFFKKVVVADNLARIVDPVYAPGADPTGLEVVLSTYALAFQVYADFSSYSDIARGTGRMLGFDLVLNFELPYFARDMAEFWRRWHMSLSFWLRDYCYIPLGGNRGSAPRVAFNLWLTLFLCGIWHGSDGTFVAFGALQGFLVVGVREYRKYRPVREETSRWPGAFVTFHLFAISLVLFRGQTFAQCVDIYSRALFDFSWDPSGWLTIGMIVVGALPVLIYDALYWRSKDELFFLQWPLAARALVYFLAIEAIFLLGRSDGLEFVYFQF